jgi:hypothetical protein
MATATMASVENTVRGLTKSPPPPAATRTFEPK